MTTTTELKEKEVQIKTDQELIRGEFSPEDAHDILNHVIKKKINFHDMRNFSSQIRFGKSDEKSLARIKELELSRSTMNELIEKAKLEGKSLRIDATIFMELV